MKQQKYIAAHVCLAIVWGIVFLPEHPWWTPFAAGFVGGVALSLARASGRAERRP